MGGAGNYSVRLEDGTLVARVHEEQNAGLFRRGAIPAIRHQRKRHLPLREARVIRELDPELLELVPEEALELDPEE